jgi:hypothetical protein
VRLVVGGRGGGAVRPDPLADDDGYECRWFSTNKEGG